MRNKCVVLGREEESKSCQPADPDLEGEPRRPELAREMVSQDDEKLS